MSARSPMAVERESGYASASCASTSCASNGSRAVHHMHYGQRLAALEGRVYEAEKNIGILWYNAERTDLEPSNPIIVQTDAPVIVVHNNTHASQIANALIQQQDTRLLDLNSQVKNLSRKINCIVGALVLTVTTLWFVYLVNRSKSP